MKFVQKGFGCPKMSRFEAVRRAIAIGETKRLGFLVRPRNISDERVRDFVDLHVPPLQDKKKTDVMDLYADRCLLPPPPPPADEVEEDDLDSVFEDQNNLKNTCETAQHRPEQYEEGDPRNKPPMCSFWPPKETGDTTTLYLFDTADIDIVNTARFIFDDVQADKFIAETTAGQNILELVGRSEFMAPSGIKVKEKQE